MDRRIGKIATFGMALAMAVLIANAFISLANIHQLALRDTWVEHTSDVLTYVERMQASISESLSAERGYLLTGQETFFNLYKASRARNDNLLNTLKEQTLDNSGQQARLNTLGASLADLFKRIDQSIATKAAHPDAAGSDETVLDTKATMDGIKITLSQMRADETQLLATRKTASRASLSKAVITFGLATALAIILVVSAYWLIQREDKLRLQSARDKNRLSNYNQLLIESTGEGIYGVDLNGHCTFLNAAGARILKLDAAKVIGSHMHSITHHTRADGTPYPVEDCPIYSTLNTGKGRRVDDEVFWRSGGLSFPVEYSAFPIRNFGQIEGVVVAFSDITLRKKIEDDLKHARDEAETAKTDAEAANVAKSQFLANMSHELRTPLNAVIMYSELLQEEAADRGVESFIPDLEKIRVGGKHLLALVNGVLDLSKIEAGKMDLYLETFDVCSMVRDVITTVAPLAQKKENKLEFTCASDVTHMHADLTKVRQILFNLLSNASKFTEKGSIHLDVKRADSDRDNTYIFAVRDSGIGMTPLQMEKLFQPFMQGDATTTRRFGGTGLGLAISRRFCQMMGGDVSVRSELGKGSTFSAHLPARVSRPETAPETAKNAAISEQRKPGSASVLVIDDEPSVRELMSRTLSSVGIHTVTAGDGEHGLRIARELKPDLIFLDVMMPKMDGWAVLASLKADPELASIPVVMLTIVGDREMGYSLGASEYLTKPIDRAVLSSVVEKYRSKNRQRVVLIVDDDDATRQVVSRTLTREGWTVVEAENGRVALDQFKLHEPNLVLLDLAMPEMDGFQFLTALRSDGLHAGIPVVVLTSMDLTEAERSQLTGRVEKIIKKGDYSREALLREVKHLVALSAPQPANSPQPGAPEIAPAAVTTRTD